MSEQKHPTRVIYHHDPASLPAEVHAQYEVRQCAPPADPLFFPDTVGGDGGPKVISLPLPDVLNRRGRLVRDDAARGWRFEPAADEVKTMSDNREPPTCGGEAMEYDVLKRQWQCGCGRDVADEFLGESAVDVRSFEHSTAATFNDLIGRMTDEPILFPLMFSAMSERAGTH